MKNKLLSQGFGLIEMMITVSIMALLMAAVAPSMTEWIVNTRLRGSAEITLAGLQKARAEAIKSNQVMTFWMVSPTAAAKLDNTCALSSASASWVIGLSDPAGACASEPSATVAPMIIESHGAGNTATGVDVSAVSGSNAAATKVGFNGFGQRPLAIPDDDIRSIDFTSTTTGTRHLRIEISAGGSVKMCDVVAPKVAC